MEFKRPIPKRPVRASQAPAPPVSDENIEDPIPITLASKIKSQLIFAGLTVVVLGGLVIGISLTSAPATHKNQHTKTKAPDYVTVLPKGDTVETLGGWRRISPPDRDPVFAYSDAIDAVPISVSQQLVPASFKGNVSAKVAELAKSYNATDKIDANGTTVYIGTSAKGPQSAILVRDELLILIKSEKKIKDSSWARYVASLELEAPVKY